MTGAEEPSGDRLILHASCVALGGRGLLILGPAGAGKSGLALMLMALGCDLVADDRTILRRRGAALVASCPETIRGRIEARGLGILAARPVEEAELVLAADLSVPETERLPPRRGLTLLGCEIALVHSVGNAHFPAALLQYLKGGRGA